MNLFQSGIFNGFLSIETNIENWIRVPNILLYSLIGIVAALLIIILILILLIKSVSKLVNEKSNEKAGNSMNINTGRSAGTAYTELADDKELVAVITAAIMASMGDEAPEDGIVVRSIRRKSSNKWQNA